MLTSEKRNHSRVPFTEKVDYYCWDKRKSADGLEISPEGIFLRTSELLSEGAMVTLRLRLPGINRGFTVLGRVVHVVVGELRRGMGIRFLDIAPRDRDLIDSYVAHRPRLAAA